MDEDTRAARAAAFAVIADIYESNRPGYPIEAVRWMAGPASVQVVDVGAGTGKLTRGLATLGHQVIAVDPSDAMLGRLRRLLPDVPSYVGAAESLPLPDNSADVLTFAQAWHWVDVPRAAAEAARVLRPGGRIAMAWNLRDHREPLMRALSKVIGSDDTQVSEDIPDVNLELPSAFGPPEEMIFRHEQAVSRNELVGLIASRSYIQLLPASERDQRLESVGSFHDSFAASGELVIPYLTRCIRIPRRS